MYTTILDESNIEDYAAYLGEDAAENLERNYFRGLVLLEEDRDDPVGWIIWELKNLEAKEHVESYIRWFNVGSSDEAGVLLKRYGDMVAADGVEKSIAIIPATKESGLLKDILTECGFDMMLAEGDDVSVALSELLAMPIFQKKFEAPAGLHLLEDMTLRNYRSIIAKLELLGQRGACDDLGFLPMNYFDKSISCYYEEDDDIKGIVLFHAMPSGSIALKVMRAISVSQKEAPKILMRMLIYSIQHAGAYYSEQTQVVVDRHNDAAFLLAEKIFPRGFGRPVYSGSRKEK